MEDQPRMVERRREGILKFDNRVPYADVVGLIFAVLGFVYLYGEQQANNKITQETQKIVQAQQGKNTQLITEAMKDIEEHTRILDALSQRVNHNAVNVNSIATKMGKLESDINHVANDVNRIHDKLDKVLENR